MADNKAAAAATASDDGNARRTSEPADVDPPMLMARGGNSEQHKSLLLLLLNKDANVVEAGSASLLPHQVTMEGLHVVAVAAGGGDDAQKFIDCVNVIASNVEKKKGAAAASSGNAEAVDHVYPRLLMAARCGDSDELLKNLLLLGKHADVEAAGSALHLPRVTMEGDTLLHVVTGSPLPPACRRDDDDYVDAGQQKLHRCLDVIVRNIEEKGGAAAVRQALESRNNKGDTPLHCAAGAGNAHMITYLVDLMANSRNVDEDEAELKKGFVSRQNDCGETALHHAVLATHTNEACIDKLMEHDPDLARVLHKDGTSPLYLAISLGKFKIAEHLYDLYSESNTGSKLSYSGPHGRNVLHAAVSRGEGLRMILEWLKDVKKTMSSGSSVAAAEPDCLLSQLTSQRDRQQKGSTPLHLAASLNRWPIKMEEPIILQFPRVWPSSVQTTAMLLNANESTAYQANDEGSYPIHVAAWSGSLGVVKLLLGRCPDCATLRDGKGRTFLHVAVEEKCRTVVRYIVCGEMPQRLSSMILNAQDSNGETALHAAIRGGDAEIFNCLFRNRQVRLDVANQGGMTPFDLSWTMIVVPPGLYYKLNPRNIVHNSLHAAGAPNGGGRPAELFTENHKPKAYLDERSKKYTEATQVMSIVTALIATVTFASAFTLPGGYRPDSGEPELAGSYAFDAFILADTLAFICSILSTCTLVYAGFPGIDIKLRFRYLMVSTGLLQIATRSLLAAFGLGLYLVVHHAASAIAACAIVFASSLYGNMEVWPLIRMATTVAARIGNRRCAVVVAVVKILGLGLLVHFGSYVIIFSLPAIRKWAH